MALPVTVPNTFAGATASIPLSQLDTNFDTLSNAINGIANGVESLANVQVTGGSVSNVTITDGSLSNVALGTPPSGTLSACTVDGTDAVGFRNVPVISKSEAYTLVLSDSGKTILHPIADDNARTFTIPANSSVAYPIGTAITFVNLINDVTIAITSDTMYLANDGDTASRTLAAYGVATAVKVASTTWVISGNGLT
jgi:hypothetical protein